MSSEISIRYMPLRLVARWPRNPKQHDFATLTDSLRRFGFTQPLIPDETTGRLVAGHGRLEALIRMRDAGEARPGRIGVDGSGDWTVPVLCGVSFGSEQEAEAYLLADNRISELGGWNEVDLDAMIRELEDLSGVGFDFPDVGEVELPEPEPDDDGGADAPAPFRGGSVFHDPVFGAVQISTRAQEKTGAGTGFTLGNVHNPPAPPAMSVPPRPGPSHVPDLAVPQTKPWNNVIQPGAPAPGAFDPVEAAAAAAKDENPQIGSCGSHLGTGIPHVRFGSQKIPISHEEETLLQGALEAHAAETGSLHGFFLKVLQSAPATTAM